MTRQHSSRGRRTLLALPALAALLIAGATPTAARAQSPAAGPAAGPAAATFVKRASTAADRASANVARAESVTLNGDTTEVAALPATGAPASAASAPSSGAPGAPAAGPAVKRGAKESPMLSFDREVYNYAADGRRDPFQSLMATGELRPLITDLRLVAVAYDATGGSVAVLRDIGTNEQYRIRTGQQLGRMRVAAIQPKKVVFTIEEFGFSRQESLALGDLTNARTQQ